MKRNIKSQKTGKTLGKTKRIAALGKPLYRHVKFSFSRGQVNLQLKISGKQTLLRKIDKNAITEINMLAIC